MTSKFIKWNKSCLCLLFIMLSMENCKCENRSKPQVTRCTMQIVFLFYFLKKKTGHWSLVTSQLSWRVMNLWISTYQRVFHVNDVRCRNNTYLFDSDSNLLWNFHFQLVFGHVSSPQVKIKALATNLTTIQSFSHSSPSMGRKNANNNLCIWNQNEEKKIIVIILCIWEPKPD